MTIAGPFDFVTDAAGAVFDVIGDAFDQVPGSSALRRLVESAGSTLEDFARTGVGRAVLRAMATGAYAALAPYVGLQIAAAAFALPGVARGQDFDDAWVDEFAWRVATTTRILLPGAGDVLGAQVEKGARALARVPVDLIGWTARQIGHALGVSDWAAEMIRSRELGEPMRYPREAFDPYGMLLPVRDRSDARAILEESDVSKAIEARSASRILSSSRVAAFYAAANEKDRAAGGAAAPTSTGAAAEGLAAMSLLGVAAVALYYARRARLF